jgi:hypothetical protein
VPTTESALAVPANEKCPSDRKVLITDTDIVAAMVAILNTIAIGHKDELNLKAKSLLLDVITNHYLPPTLLLLFVEILCQQLLYSQT